MNKKKVLLQQIISGLLFVAAIVLVGWLSSTHKAEFDWTAGNRNMLTEASLKQLKAMPGPIKFILFAPSGDNVRLDVEADLARYRRAKPDIQLEFIDPSANPQKVEEYRISSLGQMVVEYQGRREILRATTEPIVISALQRLAYAGEQWVVFLQGHGERSLDDGESPGAYGQYAKVLRDKGLKVRSLNLVTETRIPDNTSVLVIADPEKQPLAGEVQLLKEYVEKGGNLLWLADPQHATGMAPLAEALGIRWQDGVVVMPEYHELNMPHPGFFITVPYPRSPLAQGASEDLVVLPFARSLAGIPGSNWTLMPLLLSKETAWLETGSTDEDMAMDGRDIPGQQTVGLTLTRDHKGADGKPATQRIALVGDGDFLSNGYLAELANQMLGLNLVQWLASRDAQLNIDVPKAPDLMLVMSDAAETGLGVFFTFLLPLILAGLGTARWIVRRRR